MLHVDPKLRHQILGVSQHLCTGNFHSVQIGHKPIIVIHVQYQLLDGLTYIGDGNFFPQENGYGIQNYRCIIVITFSKATFALPGTIVETAQSPVGGRFCGRNQVFPIIATGYNGIPVDRRFPTVFSGSKNKQIFTRINLVIGKNPLKWLVLFSYPTAQNRSG